MGQFLEIAFKTLRIIFVLAVVSVVAYALGAAGYFSSPKSVEYDLAEAIPPSGLSLQENTNCVEPNEQERALVKVAVDALAFSQDEAGFLAVGAQKFLSHQLYRGPDSIPVCDLSDEYGRAAEAIRRRPEYFHRGRIVEYGLELIARLPGANANLTKVVAASAFNETVQESEHSPNRDIRPLARATLASLGPLARPYADKAFGQINIVDSMGTGAAQIAVAGQHPAALQTVERLMTDTLASIPNNRAVPRDIRNRLYEMAYALALGGPQAKQYVAPLRDLMNRKVESWAPPFGLIELPPRRMCRVLAAIMKMPVADLEFSYCSDTGAPYEG